ncbi:GNAT family N-acetyltransferase [Streptomyces beijiangensis]|uniref:GNAT family N-acetyltransferase n=1 Tax=Streptomyces beijiangensis TaxID=163361 RepID=A0A939JFM8_9ACTN|nr:GNAT family N-acetyltransferase [Streptomyces beijiangensis]MBO0512553.1 GNAT family N-acetyltransferase [Streptomyces beijiangensis]
MQPDGWHLTEDLDDFLAHAGDFLHSRPALHNTPLTVIEKLRTNGAAAQSAGAPVFGRLEQAGEVRAAFYRLPARGMTVTPLVPGQADSLATHLAGIGHSLPYVSADHDTSTAFAEAWQRHTGAVPTLGTRIRLYRLGTLTPPKPFPDGRGRVAGKPDHEHVVRWCGEFCTTVGELPVVDTGSWAGSRFADRHFTFWEGPDGTPVSMAAVTTMVAGMVRVDPVYTPAHLRGRGYAGAVTVEVSRAALAAGATDVVLYADPGNPTSNALYQRIGYVPLTEWAVYDFGGAAPGVSP